MPQVRVRQRRELRAVLADQRSAVIVLRQPPVLDGLPVQFGPRVGRRDRDLSQFLGLFVFLAILKAFNESRSLPQCNSCMTTPVRDSE